MRHKKPTPPPLAQPPEQQANPVTKDDGYDTQQSIYMLERVLASALHPSQDTTPEQLRDLAEMFITDMHLRKAMGGFWSQMLPVAVTLISASARLTAEFALLNVKDLAPEAKKIGEAARDLSIKNIQGIRKELYKKLLLLQQCPNEGDKVH